MSLSKNIIPEMLKLLYLFIYISVAQLKFKIGTTIILQSKNVRNIWQMNAHLTLLHLLLLYTLFLYIQFFYMCVLLFLYYISILFVC